MNLKDEFLFKKVLITANKKNYASKQELQGDNIIPEEELSDAKAQNRSDKYCYNNK